MGIENLSRELKKKLRGCKSVDELSELAKEGGIELSEDVLDSIAGGGRCTYITCEDFDNDEDWEDDFSGRDKYCYIYCYDLAPDWDEEGYTCDYYGID